MASTPISTNKNLSNNTEIVIYSVSGTVSHSVIDVSLSTVSDSNTTHVSLYIRKPGSSTSIPIVQNIVLDDIENTKEILKLILSPGDTLVAKRTSGGNTVSVNVSGIEETHPLVATTETGLVESGQGTGNSTVVMFEAKDSSIVKYYNTYITLHNKNASTEAEVELYNFSNTNPTPSDVAMRVHIDPQDTVIITNTILKPEHFLLVNPKGAQIDYAIMAVAIKPD